MTDTPQDSQKDIPGVTRRDALKTVAGAGLALLLAGRAEAAPEQWTAVGKPEAFLQDKPLRVDVAGGGVLYVTRRDKASLTAVSAKCTHRGCAVDWQADAAQLVCPCHGSAFATSGKCLHGTRRSPDALFPALAAVPVREKAGQVEVNLAAVPLGDIQPIGG